MALEVLSFAKEKNIKIPSGLSVIGFDDNPHCVYGDLALTTVRQPFEKMVFSAVSILKGLVDKKDGAAEKMVVAPELVIRDTVDFI